MAFHFAPRRPEHFARGFGPELRTAGARLYFCRAEHSRNFLRRQDRHHSLLVPASILFERIALRLPLFPLHQDASSRPERERIIDAAGWPCRRCGDRVAWDRERRRQAAGASWRAVALA